MNGTQYLLTPPAAVHPAGTTTGNPFSEAQQALADETRQMQRRVTNSQRREGVMWLVILALVGTVVYLTMATHVFVQVVEVAETGQVRKVTSLPQNWRGQTPAVLESVIRHWVYCIRRVGTDPVLQTEQWQAASTYMTSTAIAMALPFMQERFALQKKEWTTQIEILTLLPLSKDFHAVEVEWQERTLNRQGRPVSPEEKWKAIINVAVFTDEDLQRLDEATRKKITEGRNILRTFVTDYAWRQTK